MKRSNRGGFTLAEVMAVIAIIALLAALILGLADHAQKTAARKKATAEVTQLESVIAGYQVHYGNVPQTKDELSKALEDSKHPLAGLLDPWGNPYEYQASSLTTYYLWSTGGAAALDPATAIGHPPP